MKIRFEPNNFLFQLKFDAVDAENRKNYSKIINYSFSQ